MKCTYSLLQQSPGPILRIALRTRELFRPAPVTWRYVRDDPRASPERRRDLSKDYKDLT
jgi:hypothetical protein